MKRFFIGIVAAMTVCCLNIVYAQMDFEIKITASDADTSDDFGRSVAISGDYAIIGASKDDSSRGAAYIFRRDGSNWLQEEKLTAGDGAAADRFGWSVAISGDYAIVGSVFDEDSTGSVYIFKRDGVNWIQQAKLTASDASEQSRFGHSVSISGNYALVGAPFSNLFSGAAYIFKLEETDWMEQAKLTGDGFFSEFFGLSVSIEGEYAVVGAPGENFGEGAVYVFIREGTTWQKQTELDASDGAGNDFFGWSVSLSGNYTLVGADLDDDNGGDSGSAYIFKRDVEIWTEEAKLLPSDGVALLDFGRSVSLSGDYALVGAIGPLSLTLEGSAYLFKRTEQTWMQLTKLTASDGAAGNQFGFSVSLDEDYAVIGANLSDAKGEDSGSAYVYFLSLPFANDDFVTTTPGTTIEINILANDTDSKGVIIPSTVTITSEPNNGTIQVNSASGVVTYEANLDFIGTDFFTYTVQNNLGATSNVATVTITIGTAIEHNTGTVTFRLFNNGLYGFDDTEATFGGFSFAGRPGRTLFSGGFVAGTTESQVALNAISFSIIDFVNIGGFFPDESDDNFEQIAECIYSEGGTNVTNSAIGISVKQTSLSNNGDDFVILKLQVMNTTSSAINNLYVAQFADWDIGDFSANRGEYDATQEMIFQFEQDGLNDPNYYGVKCLSGASGARLQSGNLEIDSVFSFISNFNGSGSQPVEISDDYRSFIGSGPYNLAAGDSAIVGFAWLAGTSIDDLQSNADAAQAAWDNLVVNVEEIPIAVVPKEFLLGQNYPNPFNPSTTISYEIPSSGFVKLKIYNSLGQEVKTLVNEFQGAGNYKINVDAAEFANGLYFYTLKSGDFHETKKMILLK